MAVNRRLTKTGQGKQYTNRKAVKKEVEITTDKLNYERPACPVCGTSLEPLKERMKKRCHICGWEVLPLDGRDAHTIDYRGYMR